MKNENKNLKKRRSKFKFGGVGECWEKVKVKWSAIIIEKIATESGERKFFESVQLAVLIDINLPTQDRYFNKGSGEFRIIYFDSSTLEIVFLLPLYPNSAKETL